MTHQILITSHADDFPWLRVCLASLERWTSGFLDTVLLVVEKEFSAASELVGSVGSSAKVVKYAFGSSKAYRDKKFLAAQVAKMYGDYFCQQADVVWLMDSDCVVTGPLFPGLFMHGSCPVMPYRVYSELHAEGDGSICWQRPTEEILGFKVELEFMRRLPLLYPKQVFKIVREHIDKRYGKPFEEVILTYGSGDGRDISESNLLGAVAFRYLPDACHWVNWRQTADQVSMPQNAWPSPVKWFWSHGGMDRQMYFPDGPTPREVLQKHGFTV